MNEILNAIRRMINENLSKYLSDVAKENLEENGVIYYMNGNNGTEIDCIGVKEIKNVIISVCMKQIWKSSIPDGDKFRQFIWKTEIVNAFWMLSF